MEEGEGGERKVRGGRRMKVNGEWERVWEVSRGTVSLTVEQGSNSQNPSYPTHQVLNQSYLSLGMR